jgi:hypothetical protein
MSMTKFESIREAFDWWIKHRYPLLPPDVKKGRPVAAWRDYKYGGGISEKRMQEVLKEFGKANIKILISFPK